MFGTIEIFDLRADGQLVYSSGNAPRAKASDSSAPGDYLVVRRYGPQFVPRAQICVFILSEFLLWHCAGFAWHEAFSEISHRDHQFLTGDDTNYSLNFED